METTDARCQSHGWVDEHGRQIAAGRQVAQ
jgi:hypothetical protein